MLNGAELVTEFLERPSSFEDDHELLQLFLGGHDQSVLARLVRNPNPRIRACGVWIASELPSLSDDIVSAIATVASDENPRIRHDAIECLFLSAMHGHVLHFSHFLSALNDENDFIRTRVMSMLATCERSELARIYNIYRNSSQAEERHVEGLRLLLCAGVSLGPTKLSESEYPILCEYKKIASMRMEEPGTRKGML